VIKLLEIELDPKVAVQDLPVAQQQLVEIARSLSFDARVVVMDEPTAALNENEVERLLKLVRSLADRGVGVIYVSHKLAEVFAVADRITVLRDGKHILTAPRAELTEQQVVSAMVGRLSCENVTRHRASWDVCRSAAGGAAAFRSTALARSWGWRVNGRRLLEKGLIDCRNDRPHR
jgi:ABC-type sugar transport system ATPase subunit